MKYKLGDNHIGRNDIIKVLATPFTYSTGSYDSLGKIDTAGQEIRYSHRIWDSKYSLEDVYFTGFGAASLDPMKIKMYIYMGTDGEIYSHHNQGVITYNMASVVANTYRKESLLSLMSSVGPEDNIIYTFQYDATVGEETNFHIINVVQEYKLK